MLYILIKHNILWVLKGKKKVEYILSEFKLNVAF